MQGSTKEIPCRRVREMGEIERLSYRVSADQSQKSELSWECEREYKQTALCRAELSQLHAQLQGICMPDTRTLSRIMS